MSDENEKNIFEKIYEQCVEIIDDEKLQEEIAEKIISAFKDALTEKEMVFNYRISYSNYPDVNPEVQIVISSYSISSVADYSYTGVGSTYLSLKIKITDLQVVPKPVVLCEKGDWAEHALNQREARLVFSFLTKIFPSIDFKQMSRRTSNRDNHHDHFIVFTVNNITSLIYMYSSRSGDD